MNQPTPIETCPTCLKRPALCICSALKKLQTQHSILILQHPQEPDKDLGTARLAHLSLPNSILKIGLSWRNLSAALGREVQNSRWVVLYLGSGIKGDQKAAPGLNFVSKSASSLSLAESQKIKSELEGIVILDGTWSQAKALWWRNPWLLKLRRAVLAPSQKSLYGTLRKEPRRECLSTIESIAEALTSLGEADRASEELRATFQKLLDQYKESRTKRPAAPAKVEV